MQILLLPLSSCVTLDKAFILSREGWEGQTSYFRARFCCRILNSRRQMLNEQGRGIQSSVLILVLPGSCVTLIRNFPFQGLGFHLCSFSLSLMR